MNALVMYDHQTQSLWSQFLGRAVKGPLNGTKLEIIPVTQTTWAGWRELHPDTMALNKRGRYQEDTYESYYTSGSAGVLGETRGDRRLARKELVVGVNLDGNAKAYPFKVLDERTVVNDTVAGNGVMVFFDSATDTALVYNRAVEGRPLTFRIDGEPEGIRTILVDNETESRWQAFTGRAISGELKGKMLQRAPSHLSFWFAWTDWNPTTDLYQG